MWISLVLLASLQLTTLPRRNDSKDGEPIANSVDPDQTAPVVILSNTRVETGKILCVDFIGTACLSAAYYSTTEK